MLIWAGLFSVGVAFYDHQIIIHAFIILHHAENYADIMICTLSIFEAIPASNTFNVY